MVSGSWVGQQRGRDIYRNTEFVGEKTYDWYLGIWFQIFFTFTPIWGCMIQLDLHIFQMGWFNHQPMVWQVGPLPPVAHVNGADPKVPGCRYEDLVIFTIQKSACHNGAGLLFAWSPGANSQDFGGKHGCTMLYHLSRVWIHRLHTQPTRFGL